MQSHILGDQIISCKIANVNTENYNVRLVTAINLKQKVFNGYVLHF